MDARGSFFKALLFALVAGCCLSALPLFSSTQPAPAGPPEPERLRHHVRMLSETFLPRSESYPRNLDKVAGYLKEELSASGARVSEQPFKAAGRMYRNVIASFGPETGERVVVGAHYDAFNSYPAADDNASGVAGLLELARMLQRQPPQKRVDLVAFTLEEPPFFRTDLMGSSIYAQSLVREKVKVRGMICLEMIGCFSDTPESQQFPVKGLGLIYPSRGNFIAVVGRFSDLVLTHQVKSAMKRASKVPVCSLNAPSSVPGVDFSDHVNFWDRGYPAVMITDTAFYRNPAYHTAQDTAEKLDYHRMAEVVAGVHAAVQALAAK